MRKRIFLPSRAVGPQGWYNLSPVVPDPLPVAEPQMEPLWGAVQSGASGHAAEGAEMDPRLGHCV